MATVNFSLVMTKYCAF